MKNLTEKQYRIYKIIKDYIDQNGYSPSIREIMQIAGFTSPATIHTFVQILVDKGYIEYTPGKFRTIRILKEC